MRILLSIFSLCLVINTAHAEQQSLTLYSGRGESLVSPLIDMFEKDTGIVVKTRYAGTAALAVLLQEEGDKSPADLYWAQDAGALGNISKAGLFVTREPKSWSATSVRKRSLGYSPDRAPVAEHPKSVLDLTSATFKNRVGWAPANGSFQSFVTGLRVVHGEDKATEWLLAMKDNGTKVYAKNTALLKAIANGEIDYALVNHYYLPRMKAKDDGFPVAQTYFAAGDIGNLANVAGIGILKSSAKQESAQHFIDFLLSEKAQTYFTQETYENSVTEKETKTSLSPTLDLEALNDLKGTLDALRNANLL